MGARSLTLRAVVKAYVAGQNAVDGIDLEVAAGEFVSFLGPSGSGKTTTLMMIAGFERPTSGEIEIGGRVIADVAPYDRNIGMVFQNYALFPHMTVHQNVGFPLRMRRVARDEAEMRIARALAMVGLTGYELRVPRELSGGQQQRVALARALVFEPDLVVLDEPLGALDKSLREQMQVELKRIHRDVGVTMIYVTHDQTEAMAMSDRIAVFNRGRIEQIGTPGEIYFTPKTRFVAAFVGDSNLLGGKVQRDGVVEVASFGPVATGRVDLTEGSETCLLLRPETVRLRPGASAVTPTSNVMTIEETVHYGDSVLVLGRAGATDLRVRIPSVDVVDISRGIACGIEWTPRHVHVVGG